MEDSRKETILRYKKAFILDRFKPFDPDFETDVQKAH